MNTALIPKYMAHGGCFPSPELSDIDKVADMVEVWRVRGDCSFESRHRCVRRELADRAFTMADGFSYGGYGVQAPMLPKEYRPIGPQSTLFRLEDHRIFILNAGYLTEIKT